MKRRVPAAGPLLVASCAVALAAAVSAQPDIPPTPPEKVQIAGVVRELALRLTGADRLAGEKRWQDAVDEYLTLLREHGDDLVPIDPSAEPLTSIQRFVQTRWAVHERVARSPAALKAYRNRLDGPARKWLDQAIAGRDLRLLRRVAEETFCSQPAAQALELLGDFAFERGDFAEAQHWWRLLAWPLTAGEPTVHFPDADDAVLARVRAKQIITLLFQEQADRIPAELAVYRKVHGAAKGTLAGRTGKYADTVAVLAKDGHGRLPAAELEWPTFAGDPSRQRTVPLAPAPRLWAEGPTWRVRLDSGERLADSELDKLPPKTPARQLAFHPVIADGAAYVADARHVRGYHLRTGRLLLQFDLLEGRKVGGDDELQLKLPAPRDLRYTLTAADGHLFARLGGQWFGPRPDGERRDAESWLVCLPLADAGAKDAVKAVPRWTVAAPRKEGEICSFEGAPLIYQKSVYIALSRLQGQRTATSLCCYEAATGQLRWELDLCEAPEFPDGVPARCRQHLLTQAGPYLVYASHAGAVVAVDAASGRRAWAVRYPSRGFKTRDGRPSPRDLSPPVAVGRQVLLAPADLDRLWCLDAVTGRVLWEREGVEIVHLLGVVQDRVLFTTGEGLRSISAITGDDDAGWRQPLAGTLSGYGRGFLADGWVFWPTQHAKFPWRVVSALDGALVRGGDSFDTGLLRHVATGHAAFGQGCLVIAGGEELWGYAPPQPLLGPPQT
jgi:outer membrane protein assembly factor BamB